MIGGMSDTRSGDIVSGINRYGYSKAYAGSQESGSALANIGNYAWYNSNSSSTTHPVGTKTVNELGLYDLSGNVMSWCWGWSLNSATGASVWPSGQLSDWQGASSGSHRLIKGGYWYWGGLRLQPDLPMDRKPILGRRRRRRTPAREQVGAAEGDPPSPRLTSFPAARHTAPRHERCLFLRWTFRGRRRAGGFARRPRLSIRRRRLRRLDDPRRLFFPPGRAPRQARAKLSGDRDSPLLFPLSRSRPSPTRCSSARGGPELGVIYLPVDARSAVAADPRPRRGNKAAAERLCQGIRTLSRRVLRAGACGRSSIPTSGSIIATSSRLNLLGQRHGEHGRAGRALPRGDPRARGSGRELRHRVRPLELLRGRGRDDLYRPP